MRMLKTANEKDSLSPFWWPRNRGRSALSWVTLNLLVYYVPTRSKRRSEWLSYHPTGPSDCSALANTPPSTYRCTRVM